MKETKTKKENININITGVGGAIIFLLFLIFYYKGDSDNSYEEPIQEIEIKQLSKVNEIDKDVECLENSDCGEGKICMIDKCFIEIKRIEEQTKKENISQNDTWEELSNFLVDVTVMAVESYNKILVEDK